MWQVNWYPSIRKEDLAALADGMVSSHFYKGSFLNLKIPLLFIKRGKKVNKELQKVRSKDSSYSKPLQNYRNLRPK